MLCAGWADGGEMMEMVKGSEECYVRKVLSDGGGG